MNLFAMKPADMKTDAVKPFRGMPRILMPRMLVPAVAAATLLAGCAGDPVPDWKLNARSSTETATKAWLVGNDRIATVEFDRARRDVRASGQADALVRIELLQCAAQVASLDFTACEAAAPYLPDASDASRAYARYLQAQWTTEDVALLPSAQQSLAKATTGVTAKQLSAIADPLSRLVGAGVAMRKGQASPEVVGVAVDTASAQGWRRPLLAWLAVDKAAAEARGDREAASRLQRRIDLVSAPASGSSSTPNQSPATGG